MGKLVLYCSSSLTRFCECVASPDSSRGVVVEGFHPRWAADVAMSFHARAPDGRSVTPSNGPPTTVNGSLPAEGGAGTLRDGSLESGLRVPLASKRRLTKPLFDTGPDKPGGCNVRCLRMRLAMLQMTNAFG